MDLSCIYLAVRLSLALQEMAILHHKSAYQEFTKIFFQGCIAECFTEMTQYILLSIYLDKKGIHFKVKWKKNAHKDTSLPRDLGFRLGCLWPFALTTVTWFYNWVIMYIKAEVYVESKWKQGSGSPVKVFCQFRGPAKNPMLNIYRIRGNLPCFFVVFQASTGKKLRGKKHRKLLQEP